MIDKKEKAQLELITLAMLGAISQLDGDEKIAMDAAKDEIEPILDRLDEAVEKHGENGLLLRAIFVIESMTKLFDESSEILKI